MDNKKYKNFNENKRVNFTNYWLKQKVGNKDYQNIIHVKNIGIK